MCLKAAPAIEYPRWAQINQSRRAHVSRVGAVCASWADAMNVSDRERQRWLRAVALHDALKDAPRDLQRQLAPDSWAVSTLWHGPAAAARAERGGETDRGILDAVRYHSVGYCGWELVGRVLYLADFLEPGRPYHTPEHAVLLDRVPAGVSSVMLSVAAERIAGTVLAGKALLKETTDFWNGLVGGS